MSYQIAYDTARAPPRGAALVAFMEDFYRTSDTESQHEQYVQNFAKDATLIMGPKEAKGESGTAASPCTAKPDEISRHRLPYSK